MKNALIVDDFQEILDPLKTLLQEEGYTVYCCNKVGDAEKILEATSISLIITDLYMPDESGFSFIRKVVNRNQEYHNPKLLAITGGNMHELDTHEDEDDVIFADGFLKKPFKKSEFIKTVRELMAA